MPRSIAVERNAERQLHDGKREEEDALEKAARKEREYVKARLHEELKREPTEDEVNEWLREQTEGY